MTEWDRNQLVGYLEFQRDSQRTDLLNPHLTDTLVIQMLDDIVQRYPRYPEATEYILVTSAYSDHAPDSDLGPHGHHPASGPGFAVDIAPSGDDWLGILKALAASPYVWSVGLGGVIAQEDRSKVTWPTDGKFIVFDDNNSPHIHVQAANWAGSGRRTG